MVAGWSSLVARWAHNPKVGGSNPPPATKKIGSRIVGSLLFYIKRNRYFMARVLIVDDEQTNRILLRDIIVSAGHEAILAHNGREGFVAYDKQAPHLIITDIMMPEMDGLSLIKAIRDQAPDQYIIAIAAAGDLPLQQALDAGANIALEKPFHMQQLLETIQAALK